MWNCLRTCKHVLRRNPHGLIISKDDHRPQNNLRSLVRFELDIGTRIGHSRVCMTLLAKSYLDNLPGGGKPCAVDTVLNSDGSDGGKRGRRGMFPPIYR